MHQRNSKVTLFIQNLPKAVAKNFFSTLVSTEILHLSALDYFRVTTHTVTLGFHEHEELKKYEQFFARNLPQFVVFSSRKRKISPQFELLREKYEEEEKKEQEREQANKEKSKENEQSRPVEFELIENIYPKIFEIEKKMNELCEIVRKLH